MLYSATVLSKRSNQKQPKREICDAEEEDEEEVTCTTPKKKVKLEYADINDGATCPL